MQARQRAHRHLRLRLRAARDLIALQALANVVENQREPAFGGVVLGQAAGSQRPADPPGQIPVEGDLAVVGAHAHARRPARRVVGGELHHDRRLAAVRLQIGDAMALAHLAGADPLAAEQLAALAAEHRVEPGARQLLRSADHHGDGHSGRFSPQSPHAVNVLVGDRPIVHAPARGVARRRMASWQSSLIGRGRRVRDTHPPMPRDKRGWQVAPAPDGRGHARAARASAPPHRRPAFLWFVLALIALNWISVLRVPAVQRRTARDGPVQPVLPRTGQGRARSLDLHQGRHGPGHLQGEAAATRRRARSDADEAVRDAGPDVLERQPARRRCCRKRASRSTPSRRPRASRCWPSCCSASARRC